MVSQSAKISSLQKKAEELREQLNANERRQTDLKRELRELEVELNAVVEAADKVLNYQPVDGLVIAFNKTFGLGNVRYMYVATYYRGFWYVSQNGVGYSRIPKMGHRAFVEWARRGDPEVKFVVLAATGETLEDLA